MRHLVCLCLLLSAACNEDDKVLRLEVQNVAVTTPEDTPLSVQVPVVTNARLDARVSTQPQHGTLTMSGVAEGTVYTYTPTANYTGPDSIAVTFDNGETEETGTVSITVTPVNDGPVAGPDSFASGFGATLNVAPTTLLTNDTDNDSTGLTVTGVSPGTHGSVSFTGGQVVFVPEANYMGVATFSYAISDGSATARGDVTVTIGNNTAPVAVNDTATTAEDTAVNVTATVLLANDTDANLQTLAVSAVGNATNGTVTINGTMVTFTPNANYNGSATFDYTLTDGADTDTGTVTVTISAVNDVPVAGDDLDSTAEDTAVAVAASTLLSNDTDADGTALTVTGVSGATNGAVSLAAGTVTFTPTANFSGTGSFTYAASDGTASATGTVTITVTPVNDAPNATDDAATGAEDTQLSIAVATLLANDNDVDGDALLISGVGTASVGTVSLSGSNVIYSPPANYSGPVTFTYSIVDSILSDVATVTLTIAPVNDAPVAIDDAISTAEDVPVVGNVVLNDLDIDGGALAVMSVTQGASGVVTFAGGTVTYTPNANFSGADSFTYIVSDGAGGTSMATVTVTVSSVNDAPALGNDAATVAEDSFVSIDVLANDSDVDGGTLSIVSTSVPTSGTATIVNGQVVYTPGPNYNGGDSFTYTASDGQGGQAVATVTIGVTPVNDAPVGVDDAYSTEFLETFTRTAANGVLANDTDIDSTLTAALVNPPVAGSLTLNPDGSFVYTPQDPCPRTDSFTYVATDGVLNSQIVTVIFTINHPPSATNDSYTFGFGGTTSTWTVPGLDANLFTTTTVILQYGNFGRDYDQDNDVLQASIVVGPSNALSFTFNPDGSFTYQPASALNDSFVYSISDGSKTSTATVTITVRDETPCPQCALPTPPSNVGAFATTATPQFDAEQAYLGCCYFNISSNDSFAGGCQGLVDFTKPVADAADTLLEQ